MRKSWKKLGKRLLSVVLSAALCIATDAGGFLTGDAFSAKQAEAAESTLTDADISSLYSQYFEDKTYDRVSVHDPSIVVGYYEGDYTNSSTVYGVQNAARTRKEIYFVFGSHMAWAYSFDLKNWKTFENNINADYATIFEKQGNWSKRGDKVYDIKGNLWAPDVFWDASYENGKGAWLMYMSINGCSWNSSISLLKADTLNGNWTYVDTIVYSGFTESGTYGYEATNYQEVTGDSSLPDRFKRDAYTCKDGNTVCEATTWNRSYGAHAIDPCIIEDGDKLWMTYGSWSGGIWMIEIDKSTGLRKDSFKPDYEANVSDPYMGYMLAGGSGVSGEASYIQKIGNKYYLFISYGGLVSTGGYNMRVFSADTIAGPYKDLAGHDARRAKTSGAGVIDGLVGNRLMSYYKWSFMENGFTAEGHNSAFVDDDGKAYVIYHTRFDDGSEGHQLRVHQLFQAENGGLVTAPFEYSGENLAATAYQTDEVIGEYKVITMKSSTSDHEKRKCATEQKIRLHENGTVTGDFTGTWVQSFDGPYVTLTSDNVIYQGVFLKQNIEETAYETMCLTLVGNNDVSIWGYQTFAGNAMIAKAAHDMRVKIGAMTYANLELPTDVAEGVDVTWSSSNENIIAPDGTVTSPDQNEEVTLTATLTSGGYSYSKSYTTTVLASLADADTENGLKALYRFNDDMTNAVDSSQTGELLAESNGTRPIRKYNAERGSKVLQQYFGFPGGSSTSYAKYSNPLQGENLSGATVSLWINCVGTVDLYDAIWSFFDEDNTDGISGRLYLTPNMYLGYNGTGGWFDLNHADTPTNAVAVDTWNLVTVSITESTVGIYINGTLTYTYDQYSTYGEDNNGYDRSMPLKMISSAANFYTGYGSWWGSSPLYMDNIRIYNRALSDTDVLKLYVEELEEAAEDIESNVVDTSGYYYYNDYNTADISVWSSANAADYLSLEEDAEGDYRSYIKFAPGQQNTRSAYTAFTDMQALPDKYTVEFDTQLTAGNNQGSQLALATDAYGRKNEALASGYIWALSAANSTDWTVSNGDTVTLPGGAWVHIRTDISQSTGTAKLTITGSGVSYEGTITGLSATQVQGLFWLSGRYQGVGCFDNMCVFAYEVAFDANGGMGTMTNQAFKADTAAKIKKNTFTKEGYEFAGWATSADGDILYSDERSVSNVTTAGGTVTLYAKWIDPTAVTPTPDIEPSTTPDAKPSTTPDAEPSITPDAKPSTTPDAEPSTTPDAEPSTTPDAEPSTTPDAKPSTTPGVEPSITPGTATATPPRATSVPIWVPSATKTPSATAMPTNTPDVTALPTLEPTAVPEEPATVIVTDNSTDASLLIEKEKNSADAVMAVSAVIYTGASDSKTENEAVVTLPAGYLEAVKNEKIDSVDIHIRKITVDEAKERSGLITSVKITVPHVDGVSIGKVILTAEAVQSANAAGKKLQIALDNENAGSNIVTIPVSQLKRLNADTDITIVTKQINETESAERENIQSVLSACNVKEKNSYIVSAAANTTKTGMKVESVAISSVKAGDTLYVYRYNAKTGKLEEIANYKKTVSASGTVTAQIYSGNDYVITNKRLSGNKVKTLLSNVKVKVKAKKVSKGKTTKMTVDLGSTLVAKSNLNQKAAFAKQAAKVTYSSSNKKIATVSQSGKVKAKKKGKVTVSVKIKLKDGRVKMIKKKIIVK